MTIKINIPTLLDFIFCQKYKADQKMDGSCCQISSNLLFFHSEAMASKSTRVLWNTFQDIQYDYSIERGGKIGKKKIK